MIELGDYVACIVEGSAERAIIDVLLDNNFLCFGRDLLLDGELIHTRSSKSFEERYLRKGFKGSITVLRVLDSRRERFALRKEYEHKVNVINVITAPEIEMLIILNENKYNDFKKSKKKPSDYCVCDLKIRDVKAYDFVKEYFSDVDTLLSSIKKYTDSLLILGFMASNRRPNLYINSHEKI